MHANFSNELMRTCGDKEVFTSICEGFGGAQYVEEDSSYFSYGKF